MFDTCAHIVFDVMQDFALPREILNTEQVMKGLAQSLALRGLARQQSEEGRQTKVISVSLSSRIAPLNQPDIAIPLYIERRMGFEPYTTWQWIAPTKKDTVEECRVRGDLRSAFWKDDPTGLWQVTLTYDPTGWMHQLNYYTDPAVAAMLGDPLPLPTRFAFMFKYDTIINIIPGILMRNGLLDEKDQLNSTALSAINAMLAHAQNELTKEQGYNELWTVENNKDKATRGRMMRPLIGRGRVPMGYPR